ncbi:hypothetical protein Pla175_05670 [Pirellulimonas nuda]|uniref:Antitoxin ParD4 n=1 Tax=Pirellulimonas nuda TaxID=2528009 RepID=A0A518D6V5_9BACT|nr:type II toxin-antitoxin system ParD family antitoxin [Pirellulimonas nuda]QDU87210.1 hypothetical protein Pla175_05670 [Pirellulimonas nuda]
MTLPVPNDLAQEIADRIAAGQYKSEEDFVRAAVEALRRQDTELAAIEEGIAAWREGRVSDLDEFSAELRKEFGWEEDK